MTETDDTNEEFEVVDVAEAGIDSTIPAHAADDVRDEFGAPPAKVVKIHVGVRDTTNR